MGDILFYDVVKKSGLSYRTAKALPNILSSDGITSEEKEMLLDPDFYNFNNMLRAAAAGMDDIVPEKYFEDETFLIESGIDELPFGFLAGNDNVKSFTVLPEITKIGESAFEGCRLLDSIEIRNGTLSIGDYAFRGSGIDSIVVPDNVVKIGKGAFMDCRDMVSAVMPENFTHYSENLFKNDTLLRTIDTNNAEYISAESGTFEGCRSLRFQKGLHVKKLGVRSFFGCTKLRQLTLSAQEIPREAFTGCRMLDSIYFESFPKRIGSSAFLGCENLKEVTGDGYRYQLMSASNVSELTTAMYAGYKLSDEETVYIMKNGRDIHKALAFIKGE